MLTSILSYSNRGKWGKADYPGNCSGHVIYELLEHYKPKQFVEVFAGGGTGKDVAIELGFWNSVHLDLNPLWGGWNALKDEVPINSDFILVIPRTTISFCIPAQFGAKNQKMIFLAHTAIKISSISWIL
ncbi:DNA modification methylase domain protein [Paenibacillus macerans]|uniref:DNA modification methylase domain protein n=1 Tax=Paenibacillus macerans TaxID=44252 RepID=A0A090Y4Z9_PAEMA|nr:hypothetical protein [Paenibacillus macerans]KFM93833.1 DNA modification methylase domain protein [Paenibacillus macerans]